jgi:histone deacetylase complex regulatory component SIN3
MELMSLILMIAISVVRLKCKKKSVRRIVNTASQIFRQEMFPLFQKGYDHVTVIPTYASTKTTLIGLKKKHLIIHYIQNRKKKLL